MWPAANLWTLSLARAAPLRLASWRVRAGAAGRARHRCAWSADGCGRLRAVSRLYIATLACWFSVLCHGDILYTWRQGARAPA